MFWIVFCFRNLQSLSRHNISYIGSLVNSDYVSRFLTSAIDFSLITNLGLPECLIFSSNINIIQFLIDPKEFSYNNPSSWKTFKISCMKCGLCICLHILPSGCIWLYFSTFSIILLCKTFFVMAVLWNWSQVCEISCSADADFIFFLQFLQLVYPYETTKKSSFITFIVLLGISIKLDLIL